MRLVKLLSLVVSFSCVLLATTDVSGTGMDPETESLEH